MSNAGQRHTLLLRIVCNTIIGRHNFSHNSFLLIAGNVYHHDKGIALLSFFNITHRRNSRFSRYFWSELSLYKVDKNFVKSRASGTRIWRNFRAALQAQKIGFTCPCFSVVGHRVAITYWKIQIFLVQIIKLTNIQFCLAKIIADILIFLK
jgi:hypothetical protein